LLGSRRPGCGTLRETKQKLKYQIDITFLSGEYMETKRVILSLPTDLIKQLDNYAQRNFKGNRTMAVYYILKQFLGKEELYERH